MTLEAGVLLDKENEPIFWHLPKNRGTAILPDSRELWDVIWENRKRVSGFAHTHPFGPGVPGPSSMDVTTFIAVEKALGIRMDWWILSVDNFCLVKWMGPEEENYFVYPGRKDNQPAWAPKLRSLSGISIEV